VGFSEAIMSKQAEKDYARKGTGEALYRKPFDCPRALREFGVVLDLIAARVPRGAAVLDLGCGPGWTSLFLARAGYDVVGVDLAERMIEIAEDRSRRENTPATFHVADMEELALDRRGFDAVVFFDSLHHCPAYAEVLRRAFDHLRPGGWLFVCEPTQLHLISPHARAEAREHGTTELGFSRGHLRRLLRRIGFSHVEYAYDPGPGYQGLKGFAMANLRLWFSWLCCFPQVRHYVLARK
jgi:2-polyprenyl-3-methyl-5-hydroxy-6-metoxy-1,4-benzoquinol methylase